MTQTTKPYSTTFRLPKGVPVNKFVADRKIDVVFDPVCRIMFRDFAESSQGPKKDYIVDLLKRPSADFNLQSDYRNLLSELVNNDKYMIWPYIAPLLWHQDPDILPSGEAALVLTGVVEQAMMGHHVFSIRREGDRRYCDYAPIGRDTGQVKPRYPVQWCIVARKQ